MPPKKDKKEKAPPKEVCIEDYNLSEMSLQELQGFVYRLQGEIEKCRSSLTFYEVEKDKIESFWDITKQELEQIKAGFVLRCKDIEDRSRKFEQKRIERDQKLKYIEYERNRKLSELQTYSAEIHDEAKSNLLEEKVENYIQLTEKQKKLDNLQENYEIQVTELTDKRKKYVQHMVLYREDKLKDTILAYENMYDELKNNLKLLKDVEVHEYEEQKRKEYREYVERQSKSLEEMRNYFRIITGGSLALIDVMKREIQELKEMDKTMKETRKLVHAENKTLEPYRKLERAFVINLAHYEQDKKSNEFTKRRLREYEKRINHLKSINDDLEKEFAKASKTLEMIKVQFVARLRQIDAKLQTKNNILQEKADALIDILRQQGVPMSVLQLETVDYDECYKINNPVLET